MNWNARSTDNDNGWMPHLGQSCPASWERPTWISSWGLADGLRDDFEDVGQMHLPPPQPLLWHLRWAQTSLPPPAACAVLSHRHEMMLFSWFQSKNSGQQHETNICGDDTQVFSGDTNTDYWSKRIRGVGLHHLSLSVSHQWSIQSVQGLFCIAQGTPFLCLKHSLLRLTKKLKNAYPQTDWHDKRKPVSEPTMF